MGILYEDVDQYVGVGWTEKVGLQEVEEEMEEEEREREGEEMQMEKSSVSSTLRKLRSRASILYQTVQCLPSNQSQFCPIVIFRANPFSKLYVDIILRPLDNNELIEYYLYRKAYIPIECPKFRCVAFSCIVGIVGSSIAMCYVFVTLTKCDPRRFNVPGFALGSCKDDTSMEFNNPQLVRIIEVVGTLFRFLLKAPPISGGEEPERRQKVSRLTGKNLENIAAHNLRHTYSRMKGSDIRLNLNDSRWTAMSTRSTPYRTMISNRLSRRLISYGYGNMVGQNLLGSSSETSSTSNRTGTDTDDIQIRACAKATGVVPAFE
uniref:Uncharacterized protein n=1 Tax=Vespula pensylvanica TaxID=30213 RepID=A0A834P4Z2_VESPE|nr:hypothetical protein H0235_005465 [Vespula pensylvanica]